MNLREHLLSRHCDPDKYAVQLDEENGVATFFLYNLSGQITGYQQYRPNAPKTQSNDEAKGKYYTFVSDTKKPAMFGVDIVPDEYGKNDIMIITEGLFDAVRFHAANLRAVATLTNDPKPLKNQLRFLSGLKIAVCDGGAAECLVYVGSKGNKFMGTNAQKLANDLVLRPVEDKDFNDVEMTDDNGVKMSVWNAVEMPYSTYEKLMPTGMFGRKDIPTIGVTAMLIVSSALVEQNPDAYAAIGFGIEDAIKIVRADKKVELVE